MKTDTLLFSCLALSCLTAALSACGTEDRSPSRAAASTDAASTDAASTDANASAGSTPAPPDATLAAAEEAAGAPPPELTLPPGPEPVRWRACGHVGDRDVSCAEVYVPLDHDDPEGEQIGIALSRLAAHRSQPRRGTLLFNPGGPGAPGKTEMLSFISEFDAVAPGFDIIGFDPRGVAQSGDRACSPELSARLPYGTQQPALAGVSQQLADMLAEARRCAEAWGPAFNQLGSNQVVHDMDWIRQALGEPKLNFLGVSYGTRLGALYAHYFPETSGAIVLDAVVQPNFDWLQEAQETFDEQIRLTDLMFTICESGTVSICPTNARELFTQLLSDATELGVLESVMGAWVNNLDNPAGLDVLASFLRAQGEVGAEWLQQFRAPGGPAGESGLMPLATVNCIDAPAEPPTLAEVDALYAQFQAVNPAFSSAILNGALCAGWPVVRDPVPMPSAPSAPTLLVIGGQNDWRTPYSGAVAMTQALGNARLLTSNHFGHGAFVFGGECVQSAMRSFFVNGVLPPESTTCAPNEPAAEPGPEQLPPSLNGTRPTLVPR